MKSNRTWLKSAAGLAVVLGVAACGERAATDAEKSVDAPAMKEEQHSAGAAEDLEASVARMASIDRAYGADFSPTGERLSYLSSETGSPQVFIASADGSAPQQATFFDDQVGGAQWSPQGDVLAVSVAPGGGLNTQIYLASLDDAEPVLITAGGKVNNWLGEWSEDGRYLTYSSNVGGAGAMDAYLYDRETNDSRLIAENQGIGFTAALSPDGARAVVWRMVSRGDTNLYLIDLATGEEQLLTAHDGVALSDNARFADNDTILISTNIDREMEALARIDIDEAGRAGAFQIVAARDDADLLSFDVSLDSGQAALLWNVAGQSELAFFDIAAGAMTRGPELPAEIAGDLTYGPDGELLAMTVSGAASPMNVWTLSVSDGVFTQVTDSAHEGVDLASLVQPELVRYEAHDGLGLSGWLYRAPGADGPGPIVLDFHGGPEGQERPTFNSTIQALLSRGISVFAPNVRGSSGFGKTFVNLDNGALRVNAVKDIKASADHMIAAGIADPEKIGIMGGSYGGYMVMAGLTEYPDLFAAGANLFGVVNFETFFANTEPWMAAISTVEYGDPVTQADMLRDLSPIHKVDRVVAPTIVLHGANDTNVPVVEAEQVVASLEERGVPVKYILFPDEGHGWRKTENRITSTVEIVRWFETHL